METGEELRISPLVLIESQESAPVAPCNTYSRSAVSACMRLVTSVGGSTVDEFQGHEVSVLIVSINGFRRMPSVKDFVGGAGMGESMTRTRGSVSSTAGLFFPRGKAPDFSGLQDRNCPPA